MNFLKRLFGKGTSKRELEVDSWRESMSLVKNDEIILWSQLAEKMYNKYNGVDNIPIRMLFDKINEAYKVERSMLNRMERIMKANTNMSHSEIETFINAAEEYCLKYS